MLAQTFSLINNIVQRIIGDIVLVDAAAVV